MTKHASRPTAICISTNRTMRSSTLTTGVGNCVAVVPVFVDITASRFCSGEDRRWGGQDHRSPPLSAGDTPTQSWEIN